MDARIPRIIHQTWKSETLPDDYRHYRETVRAHHPNWEHWLWTDSDNRRLIEQHYPWFLQTYDGYRHNIERVDAARYFMLLHHGGVYLDLDMECLKPIDPLLLGGDLHFGLLASPTIDDVVIGNALMAAPRRHPFLGYLTRRLPHLVARDVTFTDVMNNTGPVMLTRHIRLLEDVFRFNLIGLNVVCDRSILHQVTAFASKSLEGIRAEKLLFLIHHHTNVWNIQHPPPPTPVPGYVLVENHDILGFDIDYVEYPPGEYDRIVAATDRSPEAIGFNYNGYIKKGGGRLVPCTAESTWVKPGITPWICLKPQALGKLTPTSSSSEEQSATQSPRRGGA